MGADFGKSRVKESHRANPFPSSETQGQIVGTRKSLSRHRQVFWHQSEARTAATVWNWSGKASSPGALLAVLYFSSCHIFFRPFRLFLVPTICPWVSEDDPFPTRILTRKPNSYTQIPTPILEIPTQKSNSKILTRILTRNPTLNPNSEVVQNYLSQYCSPVLSKLSCMDLYLSLGLYDNPLSIQVPVIDPKLIGALSLFASGTTLKYKIIVITKSRRRFSSKICTFLDTWLNTAN